MPNEETFIEGTQMISMLNMQETQIIHIGIFFG